MSKCVQSVNAVLHLRCVIFGQGVVCESSGNLRTWIYSLPWKPVHVA